MKKDFGKNHLGEPSSLFCLENERFRIAVTDYGAALVSFVDKKSGHDIVAGFESADEYANHTAHFGAMIGRCANRIRNAQFTLDDRTFHVTPNKGVNSLHGGEYGFDRKQFSGREEGNRIILTAMSPDGEEGYPGNLQIRIVYELLPDGIRITSEGTSDQKTLFGITNHSYFNLGGTGDIGKYQLVLNGDAYAPNDDSGTAEGVLISVDGTPFDFRNEKAIGEDFDCDDEQIRKTGGYDHHYRIPGNGMRNMAVCRGEGLKLTVNSDLPGVHFYTGNFLDGKYLSHGTVPCRKHERVCFEPEYYPNAINYEDFEKPVLQPGVTAVQTIEYLLSEDDQSSDF